MPPCNEPVPATRSMTCHQVDNDCKYQPSAINRVHNMPKPPAHIRFAERGALHASKPISYLLIEKVKLAHSHLQGAK
jgi:hypothetical protein